MIIYIFARQIVGKMVVTVILKVRRLIVTTDQMIVTVSDDLSHDGRNWHFIYDVVSMGYWIKISSDIMSDWCNQQSVRYKLCAVLQVDAVKAAIGSICAIRLGDFLVLGRHIKHEGEILQVHIIYNAKVLFICLIFHEILSIMLEIMQLFSRLYERQVRYWPFRNIYRERFHSPATWPRRRGTIIKRTLLTTSGIGCQLGCAYYCIQFFCHYIVTRAYDSKCCQPWL